MKALVVGGAGFIGCHLCEALLKEMEVVCVDNFSGTARGPVSRLEGKAGFTLCQADASVQKELDRVFGAEAPDQVFHLAANSDIRRSASDPEIEYRNTYTTTFRVLSCMRRYHVKRLFFASTSAVYGDKRGVVLTEETAMLSPISYYGAAKLGSEALIHAFSYMDELEALIFRFPNVTGPGLTHGVIFDFIHKLQKDPGHLQILGDGRQTKPYLYVTDLISAITGQMKAVKPGVSLYNVGARGSTSVKRIADLVCEEMGLWGVEYSYTGGESGWKGDVPGFCYCVDKIRATGWQASLSSDEAVQRTVREYVRGQKQMGTGER